MKNRLLIALGIICMISTYSCKDIIEKDIANEQFVDASPSDSTISSSFVQLFRWEPIENAANYRLQIAQPNFTNPAVFVADTLLSTNSYSATLGSGNYQWRVKAINSISETPYFVYNLFIDSTSNLQNQTVQLLSPSSNGYANNLSVSFSWQGITIAEQYLLQISTSGGSILSTQSVTTNTGAYTFVSEGTYLWKVTAQNTQTTSQPSETRSVVVDVTAPPAPVLTSPVNDTALTANPVPLVWTTDNSTTTTKAHFNKLQISTDQTFASITEKDTTINVSSVNMNYNFHNSVSGQVYYWRVMASDSAANESAYSAVGKLKRN